MRQAEISGLRLDQGSRLLSALVAVLLLAGCASPFKSQPEATPSAPGAPAAGRFYLDDGPGERPISELETLPDAVPRAEPLHRFANRPYVVFGRSYQPMTRLEPFTERGTATWYGRRYHDRPTAIGERYDMYAMTAAHTRLPLPSYARVTNMRNGRSVVVRVNDRGPFLHGRVIDLSYAAAARLGFAGAGTAEVEVELITDPEVLTASAGRAPPVPVAASPRPSVPMADAPRPSVPRTEAALASVAPASPPRVPAASPQALTDSPQSGFPAASRTALVSPTLQAVAAAPGSTAVGGAPRVSREDARSHSAAAPELTPGAQLVQVGAYSNRDTADAARRALEGRLGETGYSLWVRQEGRVFRVFMGPFKSAEQSRDVVNRIRAMTGIQAFARPL